MSLKNSIKNRKMGLIDKFLNSTDDQVKQMKMVDHVIEAIFDFMEHPEENIELFKSITKRLYEMYQTQDRQLRLFTMIFIPTLIAIYIRCHHAHSSSSYHTNNNVYKQNCGKKDSVVNAGDDNSDNKFSTLEPNSSIAILLLCVYNFEIIQPKTGELKTIDVRLISLAKPSIYHEQTSHTTLQSSTMSTTEQILVKNNPNESKISIFGPYHEVEQLNTGNQQSVFTILLKLYNQHIQEAGFYSWQSLCRLYLELLKQGTQVDIRQKIRSIISNNAEENLQKIITPDLLQIQFTSEFLTELLRASYFCFYNELEELSNELIEEIGKRATYKFYADVILMFNAFKNTQAIINLDREDQVAKLMNQSAINSNGKQRLTQSSITSVYSRKAAITNASFRTRKLPDDIPIVTTTVSGTNQTNNQLINVQDDGIHSQSLQQRSLEKLPHKQNGRASGFKSLDSINEESPTNQYSKNSNQKSQQLNNKMSNHVPVTGKPPRKGVMNLLKEFKDKPKKSFKNITNNADSNGKITGTLQNNISNENTDDMIPLKYLKNINNSNDNKNNIAPVPLAPLVHFYDEDDEIVNNENEDNPELEERRKLRIDISDASDSVSSCGSTTAVTLLNNNQQSTSNQLKNDSKYSTPTMSIH